MSLPMLLDRLLALERIIGPDIQVDRSRLRTREVHLQPCPAFTRLAGLPPYPDGDVAQSSRERHSPKPNRGLMRSAIVSVMISPAPPP